MMGSGHSSSHDEPSTDGSEAEGSDSFDELLKAAVSPLDAPSSAGPPTRRFLRLAIGTRVSERFVVEWYAGAGGMGDVYRCLDSETGRTVALKVIRQIGYESRFRREVSILATLCHEAIVRYIAHGTTETGTPYLAMEWLDGEDLGRRLQHNRLSVSDSITLARRVCSALALAHAHGFTHRDIKPSNVFLCEGKVEQTKLLDFGVAHRGVATQTATRAGTLVGTVGYMAPEQASGMRIPDARDDLFSLGCVLFECLTGHPAFNGENTVAVLDSVLHSHPPDAQTLQPDVPAELASLVRTLLHKDRSDRPHDVSVVVRALDAVAATRDDGGPSVQLATSSAWRVEPLCLRAQVTVWQPSSDDGGASLRGQLDDIARRHEAVRAEPTTSDHESTFFIGPHGELTLVDLAVRALQLGLELVETLPTLTVAASCSSLSLAKPEHARSGFVFVDGATTTLLRARSELELVDLPRQLVTDAGAETQQPLPFVGRETELATLHAVFEECNDDQVARTLLISSPAGCGKSRLAAEFLARLRSASTVCVVEVQAKHIDASVAWSLVRALHQALSPGLGPAPTTGAARALEDLLTQASRSSPLVVSVDDAQWADAASMQLLETCLRALCDAPIFVLGAARTDLRSELKEMWREMGAHELLLRPLRGRAAERFIRAAAPQAADPERLLSTVALCDGNPRLLRALLAEPLGGESPSTPSHTAPIFARGPEGGLAPSARRAAAITLLQEQLGALSRPELNVLCAASALGDSCSSSAIAAIFEGNAGIDRELNTLCERKLLALAPHSRRASEETTEVEYTFLHPILREAAYAMLSSSQRAVAAERTALWFSALGVDAPTL
ncbi:MAG: hypothetical protein RLZZ450_2159 [Pseudomonadota bacterium]|jgi:serine/threonine protein kinase